MAGPPDFKTTRSPDLKWGILIPPINTGRLGCTATQVAAEQRGNQGPSTPALRATSRREDEIWHLAEQELGRPLHAYAVRIRPSRHGVGELSIGGVVNCIAVAVLHGGDGV
jgi:hypothetical protein